MFVIDFVFCFILFTFIKYIIIKSKLRSFLFILVFLTTGFQCSAQKWGAKISYAGGIGNFKEVNKVIKVYNSVNDLSKDMPMLNGYRGMSYTGFIEVEEGGIEFNVSSKRSIISSNWMDNQIEYQKDLYFWMLQMQFGAYGYFRDSWYAKADMGISAYLCQTRTGQIDSISELAYNRVFPSGYTSTLQRIRPYVSLSVGYEWKFVGVKLTTQYQLMKMYVTPIDEELLGLDLDQFSSLQSRFNNVSLELYIKLGGYYHD